MGVGCVVEAVEGRRLFAVLPAGFGEEVVVGGLERPTAMAFAPDGRLFVTEQGGEVRVIRDGGLVDQPFVSLSVNSVGERGLLGVAFDPAFETNHFVYVYYTVPASDGGGIAVHNRVSRFVAEGDVARAGSEEVLLELPGLQASNHNGGAIHFGPDGKLYVAVGDNARRLLAPDVDSVFGKILRINADGSIPLDNPFVDQTEGINESVWAKGLRNPFTFAFQAGTGVMFINDVGELTFEEVNRGAAGADYGWPGTEGPVDGAAGVTGPVYFYGRDDGFAVIGGAFMGDGRYYFGDLSGNFIRRLDPNTGTVLPFATGLPVTVGMEAGPDGNLYVLTREGGGEVRRISGDFSAGAVNRGPVVAISGVEESFRYVAGKKVKLSFSATDAEEGTLKKKAISYRVERVAGNGVEKVVARGNGTAVSFKVPRTKVDKDTVFRVTVTAKDSAGGVGMAVRELLPKVRRFNAVTTIGDAASIALDDSSGTASPIREDLVVGTRHVVRASKLGDSGRNTYRFDRWEGFKRSRSRVLEFTVPDGEGIFGLGARYRGVGA